MTREEYGSYLEAGNVPVYIIASHAYIRTLEDEIKKLQEENEHLKNMLKAHTKDK